MAWEWGSPFTSLWEEEWPASTLRPVKMTLNARMKTLVHPRAIFLFFSLFSFIIKSNAILVGYLPCFKRRSCLSSSAQPWVAMHGWYGARHHQRRWWHGSACPALRHHGLQAAGGGAWYAWPWGPLRRYLPVRELRQSGIQGQRWHRRRL